MASGSDIRSIMDLDPPPPGPVPPPVPAVRSSAPREASRPQPRRMKKSAIRSRGRTAKWTYQPSSAAVSRADNLHFRRWSRAPTTASVPSTEPPIPERFARYNVQPDAPTYDAETYEKHLMHPRWSKEETDYLVDVYRDCNGKWPVIADHYSFESSERSMEDLKSRFYGISASLLQLNTPISSMTAPEYSLYETLSNFKPEQEASRKKLAEGHLYRKQTEVDEENVLLSELQRIMLNQASLDGEREDLRRRLDYPRPNTNAYQYSTSQALTNLWQQLLNADRMKRNQRLRPTGNPNIDGPQGAISARPRDSNAGLPDSGAGSRRQTRDSLPSGASTAGPPPPQSALPTDLSKAELARFGVVANVDKLPSGVTFASDRLSKPRIAKSTVQTEKIAAILAHAGVPELIPIPTPAVVESFENLMGKVQTLLEMRKVGEREAQELRVREAELEKAGGGGGGESK